MIFVGGPAHGQDIEVPEDRWSWVFLDDAREQHVYSRYVISCKEFGSKEIMVHWSLLGAPFSTMHAFKDVLLERWLQS